MRPQGGTSAHDPLPCESAASFISGDGTDAQAGPSCRIAISKSTLTWSQGTVPVPRRALPLSPSFIAIGVGLCVGVIPDTGHAFRQAVGILEDG
jgi:hypothetical protein